MPTLDTHQALQIFHQVFLVDEGRHPEPYTLMTAADVAAGRWKVASHVAAELGLDPDYAQAHLKHYVETLAVGGKYALTIWPFHGLRGGIGHALVSAIEEAVFFHSIARFPASPTSSSRAPIRLTEHYSVLGPKSTPTSKVNRSAGGTRR